MARKKSEDEPQKTDGWLGTYADMMNNLLVLFMMLYAMSVMDLKKFQNVAKGFNQAFAPTDNKTTAAKAEEMQKPEISMNGKELDDKTVSENFDKVYETLKKEIKDSGYENMVSVEKGENFVKIRFNDSVLFYPDSSQMKSTNIDVLNKIGGILKNIENMIEVIEIGGHTASTGEPTNSFFAWELSSSRAIEVLKYMVKNVRLPESKMSVSGYSKFHPVSSNDTEESRSSNRRVEIKITRIDKDVKVQ